MDHAITPVRTTCPYCGVGCGVLATKEENGIIGIKGDPLHPANFGRLCSKGSALEETVDLDGRLLGPEVHGQSASWDTALNLVARRFADAVKHHGPDSVAFYLSGQLLTEDYYVANKLMKGFIGSANIDTNSRLCMSSSVAGHIRAFGSDTVPGTYEDLELADLVILTGSNLAWCHPVLFQRLVAAKAARPGMKIIVIDPRRTMTADIADMHLAVRPDGDLALFSGLFAYLAEKGVLDHGYIDTYTTGFDASLAAARKQHLDGLCELTGLAPSQIGAFFQLFATTPKTVTCYSQGVNQSSSGTDKVNAIINCHLATGRIGKPGMGPFSLTGQPNAMGGREVGGLANMLAAHMSITNERDRDRVQRYWASPAIASKAGLKAVDMFDAVADGRIKAIWIMATNPVVSMPDANVVRAALQKCPFVVVSDITRTATASCAHVLLPSLGWGEKDGTVTNSERRISRQRPFLQRPGEAMADWWQLVEVGRRMGFGPAFGFSSPADIFAEHAGLSAFENSGTRDFDIGRYAQIAPEEYDQFEPVQWPQRPGEITEQVRLFGEGNFFHPDGKARFIGLDIVTPKRTTDHFPLTLNTGRIRDQWHTMTRTGKSARLSVHIAEPFAEFHPNDADEIGVKSADLVELKSTHGKVIVRAQVSERQARGSVFVPMHWSESFASQGLVNALVPAVTDPLSGQPASKNSAINARKFAAAAYGFAVSVQKPRHMNAAYWALAKAEGGWRMEFAGDNVEDWTQLALTMFDAPADIEPLGYHDTKSGDLRLAIFDGETLLAAIFLSRQPVAVSRSWMISQLATQHTDISKRFAVIAGRPGADKPDSGATICSCFGVGVNQIVSAIRSGCSSVEAIGAATQAGMNCGSCRSEIKGLIDGCNVVAAE
ncbi:molybdopterin-dependent oxidoreductase [Phyllobacterium sp. SB3]|uniref:nitrate reductase n=1 Tax=Phyllobacterium sp. SB3 TaxID=3156073 RepID=UPI0032AE85C3